MAACCVYRGKVQDSTKVNEILFKKICIHLPKARISVTNCNPLAQWLRHCATSRSVPGLIPGHWGFFPGHQTVPCALGSTQPLKMSTRIFLWVKTARANDLTTFMCRVPRNSGALTCQNPKGHQACSGIKENCNPCMSFIQQSVLRQVQSLFQSELSTQCDPELPLSNESILSFP